ncbi:MAG TPA: PAS domain S-box protein [Methylophilaceae bacterium]
MKTSHVKGISSSGANSSLHPDVSEERYRTLFEYAPYGILLANGESYYLDANPSMCKMLGYSREELIGMHASKIVAPSEIQHIEAALDEIKASADYQRQWQFLRKDGSVFEAEVFATTMPDGNLLGMVHDISKRLARDQEISRLTRLYAALSQINQAIVWMPTRNDLFHKICQVLVKYGGFHMAWIGWHDPETRQLVPLADYGDVDKYISTIKVYTDERPEGQGPSGIAFRSGKPYISNDMQHDPNTLLWRDHILKRGFHASAAFPIREKGKVSGILSVYADKAFFFHDKEIALLEEAAIDISFALDNMIREEERKKAQAYADNEKLFSETMIESMPGILYFYDNKGKFLRWNKNFETVSGYSGQEIKSMHPLDFFSPNEKSMLTERIGEVFKKGESSVEACLISKDGKAHPHFFTGRKVLFNGVECLVGVGINITERILAEEASHESEKKLRALFEQAPLGIAVIDSTTGRFLNMNPQYSKIVAYSVKEMLEMDFMRITHPDDIKNDLDNMRRLHNGELQAFQMEKRLIRKDGSIVWVNLTCVPLWDESSEHRQHIAMIEDITVRKLAEDRLASSEQKYRELVELANSIILRWDAAGRITFLNEFGQKFFGYTQEEIIGRHVIDTLVPPSDSDGRDLQLLMEEICANPKKHEQNVNENIRRNGERVWIAWTNKFVSDQHGKILEILSIGTDITEQRQAEKEIQELNATLEHRVEERTEELNDALVRAEAADKIKSAFLATMSHEFRTPLNSIIGFTGIILQGLAGPLNPEQTKQLGMVRGSAKHLLELINDVLDISKIEAGQLDVRADPFDLRESIERVIALVKPLAEKKKLAVSISMADDIGEIVSDRRRFEQILINLLNNAIKFTEHGSVTLLAEKVNDFCPDGVSPQSAVCCRIRDTGMGIRPEDLKDLFQPFHQVDSGLTRQHEGTGLGLAICRKLASLMGGEVSASSVWSKGSEFTVILPLNLTVGK